VRPAHEDNRLALLACGYDIGGNRTQVLCFQDIRQRIQEAGKTLGLSRGAGKVLGLDLAQARLDRICLYFTCINHREIIILPQSTAKARNLGEIFTGTDLIELIDAE